MTFHICSCMCMWVHVSTCVDECVCAYNESSSHIASVIFKTFFTECSFTSQSLLYSAGSLC